MSSAKASLALDIPSCGSPKCSSSGPGPSSQWLKPSHSPELARYIRVNETFERHTSHCVSIPRSWNSVTLPVVLQLEVLRILKLAELLPREARLLGMGCLGD
jgi:hypothetical protein